jgi:hypothetical protein
LRGVTESSTRSAASQLGSDSEPCSEGTSPLGKDLIAGVVVGVFILSLRFVPGGIPFCAPLPSAPAPDPDPIRFLKVSKSRYELAPFELPYTLTLRLLHTSSPTTTGCRYPAFAIAERTVSSFVQPWSGHISGRYVAERVRDGERGEGKVRWMPCRPGVQSRG